MFGLSNAGLIENNFQYGPRESLKKKYPDSNSYGIIVQASQKGVELYMWVYGRGFEPLTSFFGSSKKFKPIDGIKIGQAFPIINC